MLIKIVSKLYGDGKNPIYDPRFPGYFSATFNIKGVDKTINNLRLSNLQYIVEENLCKCIKDFGIHKQDYYVLVKKTTFNDRHSEYSLNDKYVDVSNFIKFSY